MLCIFCSFRLSKMYRPSVSLQYLSLFISITNFSSSFISRENISKAAKMFWSYQGLRRREHIRGECSLPRKLICLHIPSTRVCQGTLWMATLLLHPSKFSLCRTILDLMTGWLQCSDNCLARY